MLMWFVRKLGAYFVRKGAFQELPQHPGYVEPDPLINPILVVAAMQDIREADRVKVQASLNACLLSVRPNQISGPLSALFMDALAKGHTPDEAVLMVIANSVYLGMHVERRLQKAEVPA